MGAKHLPTRHGGVLLHGETELRGGTLLHEGTLPHGGRREARPYGVLVVVLGGGDDVGFFVVDTSVAPELEPAAVVVGS